MKRLFILAAIFLQAQPVSIPIQNPSFEAPANLPNNNQCGSYTLTPPLGWQFSRTDSGSDSGVVQWTCETLPEGRMTAFLNHGTLSQDLGVPPQFGTYAMKFFVANWFYAYPAKYSASLSIGTNPVCSTSGYALGDFTEVTLVCPVSNYISVYHRLGFSPGNLFVSVSASGPGWPLLFDDISLTFVPYRE